MNEFAVRKHIHSIVVVNVIHELKQVSSQFLPSVRRYKGLNVNVPTWHFLTSGEIDLQVLTT